MTKTKALSVRETALCGLFAALTAAGAFIRIDLPVQPFPMHFTLQIFFALLSGFILGPRLGAVSVGIYLAVGLVGIPVFAAGGGPAYLIRPTFGFLLGFLFAAWLAGKISRMGRRTSLARNICAAVVGMGAYYLSGILYFYFISNSPYLSNMHKVTIFDSSNGERRSAGRYLYCNKPCVNNQAKTSYTSYIETVDEIVPPDDLKIDDPSQLKILKVSPRYLKLLQKKYVKKVDNAMRSTYSFVVMYGQYTLGGFGFTLPQHKGYDLFQLTDFSLIQIVLCY